MSGSERTAAEARLREAVGRIIGDEGARVGFLLDSAGMVSAAGGNPGDLEPTSFVSLAAAQLAAARDLASIASGGDLSQLMQEGGRSRLVLSSVHGGRTLALLFDSGPGSEGRISGTSSPGRSPDVTEVDRAAQAIRPPADPKAGGSRTMGTEWSREAADEVDRVFGGEG